MVLWNMPQRVGERARMAVLLRESRHAWDTLDRALDERGADVAHGDWSAPVVYGHVARWLERRLEDLENYLESGTPLHSPSEPAAEAAQNAAWAARDVTMPPAEARSRCTEAFEALHGLLARLDPNDWDEEVLRLAEDDLLDHIRAHLRYIERSG